jgi:hypothetical protein
MYVLEPIILISHSKEEDNVQGTAKIMETQLNEGL